MSKEYDFDKLWTRFLLKLKVQHPFFATVAMFANFRIDEKIEVAQTLEKGLSINPNFLASINEVERYSYLLHQVLHLALDHIGRGLGRDPLLWNIAADISVNNIITESTEWPIAPKTAWNYTYSGYSVENIYASLQKQVSSGSQESQALPPESINSDSSSDDNPDQGGQSQQSGPDSEQQNSGNSSNEASSNEASSNNENSNKNSENNNSSGGHNAEENSGQLDKKGNTYNNLAKKYNCQADFNSNDSSNSQAAQEYWRSSVIKAKQLNSVKEMGKGSASLELEIDLAVNGVIDWRPLLWKYATPDFVDYHEFDHRFIHAGYYTETLLSESIVVDVVVDTSGSISSNKLSCFLTEMLSIYACHPDVKLRFFYADDKLHGPYEIPDNINALPVPVGAGGTSFVPYFNELAKNTSLIDRPQAIIYFTDGFGKFPKKTPSTPVLWLLTEDGLPDDEVPFGITVRIKE